MDFFTLIGIIRNTESRRINLKINYFGNSVESHHQHSDHTAMQYQADEFERWLSTQHPKSDAGKKAYHKAHFWLREIKEEIYNMENTFVK